MTLNERCLSRCQLLLLQKMKSKVFLMSILMSSSMAEECSDLLSDWSCLPEGNNLLETKHNVATPGDCRKACKAHSSCTHFTHYNSEVAASMASSCLLLSSCSSKNLNCRGCKSGTRDCNPRCEIPKTGGAIWVCSNNKTFAVGSEECFFTCGTQMVIATCISGDKWDVDLNTRKFQCPCGDPPSSAASLSCSSEPSPVDPTYPGGTVCRYSVA